MLGCALEGEGQGCWAFKLGRAKAVADTADSLNHAGPTELSAKCLDVAIDGTLKDEIALTNGRVHELVARIATTRLEKQTP